VGEWALAARGKAASALFSGDSINQERLMSEAKRVCLWYVCASIVAMESIAAGIQSNNGVLTFEATTNVTGVEIKGKSTSLTAGAEVLSSGNQLLVRDIQASVPVNSLATGMKVRDEHMRRYIFRTNAGDEPDLRFAAGSATCSALSAREYQCPVQGTLEVRGTAKPAQFTVRVKPEGAWFHASFDAVIKLSTFGIERPSQFGVRAADEVKVHVEFTTRASALQASTVGAQ
jgi:polyisoprenoid-binding protein YceI